MKLSPTEIFEGKKIFSSGGTGMSTGNVVGAISRYSESRAFDINSNCFSNITGKRPVDRAFSEEISFAAVCSQQSPLCCDGWREKIARSAESSARRKS